VPIFWEDSNLLQWSSGTNDPQMAGALGQLLNLVNSPWSAGLTEYGPLDFGSIARPRMATEAPIFSGPAPSTGDTTANFVTADIMDIIDYEVAVGHVPPPLPDLDDVVYVVFIPGSSVAIDCGYNGCNGLKTTGATTNYAWEYVNSANFGQALAHERPRPS
jgi:hypothetical protein